MCVDYARDEQNLIKFSLFKGATSFTAKQTGYGNLLFTVSNDFVVRLAMIKLWVIILEGCLFVIVSSPFILIYFRLATI